MSSLTKECELEYKILICNEKDEVVADNYENNFYDAVERAKELVAHYIESSDYKYFYSKIETLVVPRYV